MSGYTCRSCGQFHADLPMHYGADAPIQWYSIAPDEVERRAVLSRDQCIIDNQFFFVVGWCPLVVEWDLANG